ncbi:FAD-binding oxidoreductase [Mycobacterium sp. Aquia_216]|uniref:2Fe-2S iron-sulfur cluster-binding protein n=1 Tax=Mycobacterium sp. Aquia_216 TaxID=2991729 RepID=UPI00227B2AC3|nr:2Fe-2S iron-sulfur cluster-binding protein [Mycobacterium sp. Aquia_216]WAJ44341.1 FAD-binding oxidoreductase [Mycobacterium sp. Aquia_216]
MTIETQTLHRLTTVDEVEAIIGRPPSVVLAKELDHLDSGCEEILAHSPVAGVGYLAGPDACPVSTYVGGVAGFAEVLNPNRISLPFPDGYDPPQQNTGISFVFLLPGVGEVLRLNGRVLRSGPSAVINVEQAFVHCAKAIHRSGLWNTPESNKVDGNSTIEEGGPTTLDNPAVASFFAASPFFVVSTWAGDLSSDTSPRGDSPGFIQILDANTIAIPDRKGNKRADTFHNLVENDRISLAVLVPGSNAVLHIRGTGYMSDAPDLLATMMLKGTSPHAALIIKVSDVEFHSNTAIFKSDLWHLSSHAADEMPNMMALASKHVVIMADRAKGRSALGIAFGVLAKYPRLAKAVADLTYKSELTGEGYPSPGSVPELISPTVVGAERPSGGWFRRLLARRRVTRRNDTAAGSAIDLQDVNVVDVIHETASATTLVFENQSRTAFDFKAGQFFTISAQVGKRTIRRAYSASCAPGGQRCALTIKQVTDGSMSTYLNTKVKPGDRLQIMGPSGNFCIPNPNSAPPELVLIAVGSGITPIMSILRTMMTETTDTRVALIYGNRTEDDIIFAAALAELCARYPDRLVVRHVLTKPSPAWTGATGRLDEEGLRRELSGLAIGPDSHYYICGPEAVMEGARRALIDDGVTESRIHRERFVRAVDDLDVRGLAPQTMVVDSGGTQLASLTVEPGSSLLQAGLAARLPMPYSCTVGNCGDCMVKLLDGEVAMGEPNCLEPEQRSNGYILACIAKPRSPVRIEIIDE